MVDVFWGGHSVYVLWGTTCVMPAVAKLLDK